MDFATTLAAVRAEGSAADGLVRVTVQGSGEIADLVITPRAMRMPSVDLAAAVRAAHQDAWSAARAEVQEHVKGATPDIGGLSDLLDTVGAEARQRMADFARAAEEIARRVDQH